MDGDHYLLMTRKNDGSSITNLQLSELNEDTVTGVVFRDPRAGCADYVCEVDVKRKRIRIMGQVLGVGVMNGEIKYRGTIAVLDPDKISRDLQTYLKELGYAEFSVDTSRLIKGPLTVQYNLFNPSSSSQG